MLNFLRSARVNLKLSAYTYTYRPFNFTATPMAPLGTKVLVHVYPDKRALWDLNRESEWYIGPSLNYYRCIQCYIPSIRAIINSDTIEFFLYSIPFPLGKITGLS